MVHLPVPHFALIPVFSLLLDHVIVQAQTSCPNDFNLTRSSATQPSQTATHLDIQFTCIYNDFATGQISYQFVPTPFVRVEPGDQVAVYSTPPDIYGIVNRDDGSIVSFAQNNVTEQPGETFLVITWPATQLERLTVGTINGTLLLAEGFTNLQEINVAGRLGGFEGFISTEGPAQLRLTGENLVGKHVQASNSTQLQVYIEMGEGDVEIVAPPNSITGVVHAVRNAFRTGSVSLDGVQSITSTGQGPGKLFANDCMKVTGNCNPLNGTLSTPNPDCRLTSTCLVTVFTTTQPVRTCTGQFPTEGDKWNCFGNAVTTGPGSDGINAAKTSRQVLVLMGITTTLLILPVTSAL